MGTTLYDWKVWVTLWVRKLSEQVSKVFQSPLIEVVKVAICLQLTRRHSVILPLLPFSSSSSEENSGLLAVLLARLQNGTGLASKVWGCAMVLTETCSLGFQAEYFAYHWAMAWDVLKVLQGEAGIVGASCCQAKKWCTYWLARPCLASSMLWNWAILDAGGVDGQCRGWCGGTRGTWYRPAPGGLWAVMATTTSKI